jgi:hypothetical protein
LAEFAKEPGFIVLHDVTDGEPEPDQLEDKQPDVENHHVLKVKVLEPLEEEYSGEG